MEIDSAFEQLNIKSVYIAKKNIRKIIRITSRFIKYSGKESTEATLLIYVCKKIKSAGLDIKKSVALANIYTSLTKKIKNTIEVMHEDLQYDFNKELDSIE